MKSNYLNNLIIISFLFASSCRSVNNNINNNYDSFMNFNINEELSKEENKNTIQEIINNRLTWYKIDPSEKVFIFPEGTKLRELNSVNLDNFIYTFNDVVYLEDINAFKLSFFNKNGIKEIIIGLKMTGVFRYNENTKEMEIVRYYVWQRKIDTHIAAFPLSVYDVEFKPNLLYSYDCVMKLIDYNKIFLSKPLISDIPNQPQIGKRYLIWTGIYLKYKINNNSYAASIGRQEFVLIGLDGTKIDNNRDRIFPEIEYIGMDTFITQSGYLRVVPIFKFIGYYRIPNPQPEGVKFINERYHLPKEGRIQNRERIEGEFLLIDTINKFGGEAYF